MMQVLLPYWNNKTPRMWWLVFSETESEQQIGATDCHKTSVLSARKAQEIKGKCTSSGRGQACKYINTVLVVVMCINLDWGMP